jgi:hypothetical protein
LKIRAIGAQRNWVPLRNVPCKFALSPLMQFIIQLLHSLRDTAKLHRFTPIYTNMFIPEFTGTLVVVAPVVNLTTQQKDVHSIVSSISTFLVRIANTSDL